MPTSAAHGDPGHDIVRARVRTLGVEEHHFTMESGALPGTEWYIYDVGGSRSVAIIFLAPLAFNLTLDEDAKVNRLEDSIMLWREVCQNALLAKTTLILFLNKVRLVFPPGYAVGSSAPAGRVVLLPVLLGRIGCRSCCDAPASGLAPVLMRARGRARVEVPEKESCR
ncbi:hypothetical protein NUW54_g2154 [Trametes sanguinea]|uniref:Uncharacterized protein n=1 Tax=Trametes sanguinea TaxID=158606 RepID=A0ACC1Q4D3_9APHY|nr:hypothetical protein NUW54_g2154 [Trametes sanguinea]